MRLIDADALMEEVNCKKDCENCDFYTDGDSWCKGTTYGTTIMQMPTIDAEPVKHGHLCVTDAYPHRIFCSICNKTLIPNEEICFARNEYPKYCMWCGAKMDEEVKR